MKLLTLAAFMLFSFTAALAQDEPLILMTTRTEGPPEPRLEAIALIDHGQFKAPGGIKNKVAATFIKKYLPAGRKFFVVFGGGAAGTINITETGLGCNDLIYAIGPWNPGSLGIARIHGQVQGLATNSDMIARGEIWRRAPTAAERTAAVDLAKTIFMSKGVTTSQMTRLDTVNLTAIDVDGDNRAELVGTFSVAQPSANATPRYLFLIADAESGNVVAGNPGGTSRSRASDKDTDRFKPEGDAELVHYKIGFSSYRYLPKSDVYNSGAETLIDYLDLDRDGVAEIVTSYSNDKAGGYHIYRRMNGEWKVVYESSTDFCLSEGGD
jgi:hypothetical protein